MIEVARPSAFDCEIIAQVFPQVPVCVSVFEACGSYSPCFFLEKSISSDA